MQGRVKMFNTDKMFGFVTADDGQDVFFHASVVEGGDRTAIGKGSRVELEVENNPKGPRAAWLRVVGP